MDFKASCLRNRPHESQRRAFAIGSRNMNNRRQIFLRVAELLQQSLNAVQGKINDFKVVLVKALDEVHITHTFKLLQVNRI